MDLEEEFISAIIDQNINYAKELLLQDINININYRNIYGQTLLILSVNFDLLEIVNLLLDKGAEINLFDNCGESALTRASFLRRITIVELLVRRGANINHRNNSGLSALILAGFNNDIDLIKILISGGANINDVDKNKNNALMIAAAECNFEVCSFLVSNGIDLMATDVDGNNALVDYGVNSNNGLSNKVKEFQIMSLKKIWIQKIKDERWTRRKPILCVLAEHAYRPLKARALEIERISKANSSKLILIQTSRAKEVLCDFGLSRYIIKFL